MEAAREAGFDLVGIAPLAPPADAERFTGWLEAGHHADMEWLERQRERIVDPAQILPEGRSMLIVGLGHSREPVELEGGGLIARYAAGRDYHNWMGKRLRSLARKLAREGLIDRSRMIVDAGPLLERSHAAEAGLGFASKAANLLSRPFGPWFFLGELIIDVELTPTKADPIGSCGSCTACIDACPTGAILEPGVVSSSQCISYLTIEKRGSIPTELRESVGEWAFGCDICSEVCPWGHKAPNLAERFGTHAAVEESSLNDWLSVDPEGPMGSASFPKTFEGSALRRPKAEGLARNAAIVLGNRPTEAGGEVLRTALTQHPSPSVREAAGWALAKSHSQDQGVHAELEHAARNESDEDARSGLDKSLAGDI
ncbi:MAG: epoxyqueuosine reductase [Planctomycetota bacterium]|jgi:epoxyqueuosine reductase